MKYFIAMAFLFSLAGCIHLEPPGVALNDVRFAESPYILKRDGNYYLHYRISLDDGHVKPVQMVLYARKSDGKAYYWFSVPISHPEYGQTIERPLACDGFTEYAEQNAVYWWNPDYSETRLEIKEESELKHRLNR